MKKCFLFRSFIYFILERVKERQREREREREGKRAREEGSGIKEERERREEVFKYIHGVHGANDKDKGMGSFSGTVEQKQGPCWHIDERLW